LDFLHGNNLEECSWAKGEILVDKEIARKKILAGGK